jgi:hypothetical protein
MKESDPELDPDPDPLVRGTDLGIRIRIRTITLFIIHFRKYKKFGSLGTVTVLPARHYMYVFSLPCSND